MKPISYYRAIQGNTGVADRKSSEIKKVRSFIENSFDNTPDSQDVTVNDVQSKLLITPVEDENIKKINSAPSGSFNLGDIVEWQNTRYLIFKIDGDRRFCCSGRMQRCNTYIKWKNSSGDVIVRHGIGEDATKYSEGTQGSETLRVGEFQLKIKVKLDPETVLIRRDDRFMIDAEQFATEMAGASAIPNVYRVTRRNVVTGTFEGTGYVEITLVEDQFVAGHDNIENMLACKKLEIITNDDETCDNADSGSVDNGTDDGWL